MLLSSAKSLVGGFGLHVVSFSGSKATFRGRTATARWSSIDHFVCNQAARTLLTSPRVNRQPYISDHWPIYASLLAVPPTPPDVFIPTFNPVGCKELAPTISLCNQFSILANLPDGCDSDTVTNRLLDIINPNTAFSSLSNLPLIDTPVPVQHRRLYRATTKKAICKAKNAYRAWLASRNSILSPQETIQGKHNQYILAEATASRLTKQDDRLRWRSHCTRIDNLLAGGCAKQAWNAAKRMACASGHSCRSSNPIRNEEGVLQFQPISICNTLRSHYMRLSEAVEGHSLDPTHWESMPQPAQHIPSSSTLSMDLPFSLRELDHALGSMHPRKAPGDDGITTALMQAIAYDPKDHGTGDVNLDRPSALALLRVANTIFLSGVIPKVWSDLKLQCLATFLMSSKGGRPRDSVYEQFGDTFAVDNLKLKRRKCNHCGRDSADSAQKLKQHLHGCKKAPGGGLEKLPAGYIHPRTELQQTNTTFSATSSLIHSKNAAPRWMDTMGDSEQQFASRALAKAMHRQAVLFSFFAYPLWKEFFTTIRPTFRLPPPDVVGGDLLDLEYMAVQSESLQIV
ncbi:hypothetical protein BASA50_010038 [Batrachochytrium salamandrivorans]|uniref:Uncharacterized protein n=1 Tax=Batrachochytrium salamandrivorans TaxID=1357716 RepID=A0ABQ8F030_9FUNG|nr:hypothetical protein BASA50_010038 [Batrachochytrium salamandrivorans]